MTSFDEVLDELVGCAAADDAAGAAGPRRVWPAGMTMIIGLAFLAAIRLSRMNPARPTEVHESSLSPAPCRR